MLNSDTAPSDEVIDSVLDLIDAEIAGSAAEPVVSAPYLRHRLALCCSC